MVQDTLLGFPAHTLPYRRGEFTTLSTVSKPARGGWLLISFFHGEKDFRSFFISFQGTQSLFPYAENSRRGVSAAAVPVIQFSVTPRLRCRS